MTLNGEPTTSLRAWLSRMPPKGQSVVASSVALRWDAVQGVILQGRIEEFFDFSAPFPIVMFVLKGAAQLDWRRTNRYSRMAIKPGDVLVAPPSECNRMRTDLAIEVFCCLMGPERLNTIVTQEWGAGHLPCDFVESLSHSDEDLWDLGQRLAGQLRSPLPGSRLYADSLQTQIAILLLRNHSTLTRGGDKADELADSRLRPVIDYIQENLCDDVSLETLAGVAGLSPNYFLGAFREATGLTPHRYVTELRIAKACKLLEDPHRPITEVSLAVGFSSQSHLTEVFRRTMNKTPAAYRREVLGMARPADGTDS